MNLVWNKRLLLKSECIRICFMEHIILPRFMVANGCLMAIESFRFPVTQCGNYWKYGHIKRFCPSKARTCRKCGKKHESCDTNNYKSVNCKGEHILLGKSMCPAFQKEKKIRLYMSEHNCTLVAIKRTNNNGKSKTYKQ